MPRQKQSHRRARKETHTQENKAHFVAEADKSVPYLSPNLVDVPKHRFGPKDTALECEMLRMETPPQCNIPLEEKR